MKWLVLLLLLPTAMAGPSLSLLVHHPYPDASDPFGSPYQDGVGYYQWRYGFLDEDRNGFDFPHMVMDGVLPVEGLPDGGPFIGTNASYRSAYETRANVEAPVHLVLSTSNEENFTIQLQIDPVTPLDETVQVWFALAEDNIFFDAGRLGNGVTNHRMTVAEVLDAGPISLLEPQTITLTRPALPTVEEWYIVAWLQEDADVLQFDANEVIQATTHPLRQTTPTIQDTKGVLMQLYSATWCDTCLFGDLVAENMLHEYGPATSEAEATSYLNDVPVVWVGLAAIAGAALVLAWPMRRHP